MIDDSENLLVIQARNGVPLLVPWGHEKLTPGTGFRSEHIMGDPWVHESAFIPFDSKVPYALYEPQGDSRAYFRSAESYSQSVSNQHYSGSLCATVDVGFATASVTGSYDKDIKENKDSTKVSRNVFFRAGVIRFAQEPMLNATAYNLLSRPGGEDAFRALYGDYFISGFTLGGDSGAFMSVDDVTKQTTDTVTLKATVKVVFFKPKTYTTSTTKTHIDHSLKVTLSGYDTMEGFNIRDPKISLASAQQKIVKMVDLADDLEARVMEKLRVLGITSNRELTLSECTHLCGSGIVVGILLIPFRLLRGYQVGLNLSATNGLVSSLAFESLV